MGGGMGKQMDNWVDKQLLNQAMKWESKEERVHTQKTKEEHKRGSSMGLRLGGEAKSSHQHLYRAYWRVTNQGPLRKNSQGPGHFPPCSPLVATLLRVLTPPGLSHVCCKPRG